MEETELDEYNLSTSSRKQSLKVSLINNNQISMILTFQETNQEYSSLITLEDLKNVSEAFNSIESIQNALNILKSTIESNNIFLAFTQNNESIGIKFNIILDSINYPPFDIILYLQENENEVENVGEGEVEELPPTFDYQGDEELEKRYGKITKGTTEYVKPILEPDFKPPILHLKYIEPILQVHYPDGTTQNKALPPRIENINGETPNISEEEFRKIQEEMDKNTNSIIKDFERINGKNNTNNFQRSNSVIGTNNNFYNSLSVVNNENTNGIINNPLLNSVRPAMESNSSYSEIYNRRSSYNPNIANNNNLNKIFSDYSTMTHNYYNHNRQNADYLKNSHYFSHTENINFNNIVERRPRMINMNTENQRNIERSSSNPSQNLHNINSIQKQNQFNNIYQPNPTSNPFQTNEFLSQNEFNNNNGRFPFDRNTERIILTNNNQNTLNQEDVNINNYQSLTMRQPQQDNNLLDNINNLLIIKPNIPIEEQQSQIQSTLNLLQKHQQKLEEVQQKLAQIKQQQQKYHIPKHRQLREQIQIQPNQNINSENNNNNISQSLNSQFNKQTSGPLLKREISQEQINFAKMASIQNEEDPNANNMKAIILPDINEEAENKEIQNEPIQREVLYEEIKNNNEEQNEENNNNEQNEEENEIYEELFRTEDGKIIFRNGLLRGIIHKYYEIDDVVSKIQDILSKGVKFHLAYKAFDLDDKAETFHKKCDNLDMSLVLIETDQDVRFGGFTTKTWKGDCLKKIDNCAFVFNLNNHKIYDIVTNQPAIGSYPKFGPVFFGCQIRIFDEFFTNGGTTCKKGLNYKTTYDYELNNGKQKYLVKDIEIYRLELIDID